MSERPYPNDNQSPQTWLDDDGLHIWFGHTCTDGWEETMLPYPTWSSPDGYAVVPSVNCTRCHTHSHFQLTTHLKEATEHE